MKLSIKITLLIIVFAIVFAASFIFVTSNLIRDRLYDSQTEWVETLVHAISEGIAYKTINGESLEVKENLKKIVENDLALDYAFVTDFQGRIFAHTFEKGFPKALLHQHNKNLLTKKSHSKPTEHHQHSHENHTLKSFKTSHGDILDISYPLVEGLDSHLHLGVKQNEILLIIQQTNKDIIVLVFFLTFIGSIVAIFITQRVTSPLYQLANYMHLYGQGKLTQSINLDNASQEVRDLSQSFVKMINDRKDLEISLLERDTIYHRLLESTTAIPWEFDIDSWRFTYIGKQIANIFNYPLEDWYNKNFWFDHIFEDDRKKVFDYCKKETTLGHDHELEYRMLNDDDRIIWIREDVSIIFEKNKPVRLQGFMFDITQRKQAEIEYQQYVDLMQQKQSTFFEWAKSKEPNLQQALHRATELSADSLKTDRVSIWLYNEKRDTIVCQDLYSRQAKTHEDGLQFAASDFPNYFSALEANRTLAITDARHEPETKEFTDSYLIPFDIHSMMDVPIRLEGKIIGVICHEHTQHQRDWTIEQQDFAASISNSIALALETEERKKAEQEIQDYREHLEELVQLRTAELATANKELESFSYSISHDLRSPLRAIDGFSLVLLEDYENSLDEEGKDFLQRIRANTQRMAELINDILALSQLSRTPLAPKIINLSNITREIVKSLSDNHMDRKVHFHIQETQDVQADAKLIKIILENLIQNAWKYTGKKSQPEIEFGTEQQNNQTVYFVKDNGAGFDMKYADNLFGVFQRLHGNEFEGTGIGLATVKRLINRHGGRIWAEAEVDKGATFYFTLK